MGTTTIEWCDTVWNPVTGCQKVSQGCKNCYAERIANRFWGDRKFTDVVCHEDRLEIPLSWKKPRRVFVNSMSDLFHLDVPDKFIGRVWSRMLECPNHIFMILTKRPERMVDVIGRIVAECEQKGLRQADNIWLGVSVENQQAADDRIPYLLQTPAAVRFVSCEPLLGRIHLDSGETSWLTCDGSSKTGDPDDDYCCLSYENTGKHFHGIDMVIAGCESGPGARETSDDNFRHLRNQCQDAGIKFFLKQMAIDGKMVKMPELDGIVWNQFPE
jgi:protein gp37